MGSGEITIESKRLAVVILGNIALRSSFRVLLRNIERERVVIRLLHLLQTQNLREQIAESIFGALANFLLDKQMRKDFLNAAEDNIRDMMACAYHKPGASLKLLGLLMNLSVEIKSIPVIWKAKGLDFCLETLRENGEYDNDEVVTRAVGLLARLLGSATPVQRATLTHEKAMFDRIMALADSIVEVGTEHEHASRRGDAVLRVFALCSIPVPMPKPMPHSLKQRLCRVRQVSVAMLDWPWISVRGNAALCISRLTDVLKDAKDMEMMADALPKLVKVSLSTRQSTSEMPLATTITIPFVIHYHPQHRSLISCPYVQILREGDSTEGRMAQKNAAIAAAKLARHEPHRQRLRELHALQLIMSSAQHLLKP